MLEQFTIQCYSYFYWTVSYRDEGSPLTHSLIALLAPISLFPVLCNLRAGQSLDLAYRGTVIICPNSRENPLSQGALRSMMQWSQEKQKWNKQIRVKRIAKTNQDRTLLTGHRRWLVQLIIQGLSVRSGTLHPFHLPNLKDNGFSFHQFSHSVICLFSRH